MLTYHAQVHAHWVMYPTLASSSTANIDIMKGMGWLLGQKVASDVAITTAVDFVQI